MTNQFKSLFFSLLLMASIGGVQDSVDAATLAEIQRRGKIIVAVKDNLPPLGFRDEQGNLQGLEIDIARKLATEIFGDRPNSIEFLPVTNQARLQVVLSGQVDIAIGRVTITPTRSRVVDFSRSYYADGTGIITDQPNIKTTEDLSGKKVAVLNHSSTIGTLQFILPQVRLVGVDSYAQAKSLLERGQVVAFAADIIPLNHWLSHSSKYRILPRKLSTESLGIVLPKGLQYDPLRQLIDRALQRWQTDGWLQQRIRYWGLRS
jgi:polar amino acid transport system substrate-binding protein